MINNNAWLAINELVSRAAGVADLSIVDDNPQGYSNIRLFFVLTLSCF